MTNDTNEDDDNDDISTNYTSCRQCAELFKYEISDKNSYAFSRKCHKASFFDIFLDLTAVNMRKSPYSLYKSCRQLSNDHSCKV